MGVPRHHVDRQCHFARPVGSQDSESPEERQARQDVYRGAQWGASFVVDHWSLAVNRCGDPYEMQGCPSPIVSIGICTVIVSPMFSMPFYQPIVAVAVAAFVSILAVRAMGETDLNPASGVGKISQVGRSATYYITTSHRLLP